MQGDETVIGAWRRSAPFWERYRDTIRQMFAPVSQALIEDACVGRGDAVLDVATGPGEPALQVAAFVGPKGRVVGVDVVPAMVAAARRASERAAAENANFTAAAADQLPYPAGAFDAAVSRFGVMFFPSPLEGVREMLRVLKPGKKLALAVWHSSETNPFFHVMSRVVERFIESPPAADAQDAFRFASPGKLREVLHAAGATACAERLLQFTIRAPLTPEEFCSLRGEMSEKFREAFAALPEDRLAEMKLQLLEALRPYFADGGMSFPAEVLIVSGVKGEHAR